MTTEERLKEIIASLKHGDCWCEMAVGNPMVRGHSPACMEASRLFKASAADEYDVKVAHNGREVIRIRPDGTYSVFDLNPKEAVSVIGHVVAFAAGLFKKVKECEAKHGA